jgi:peroxiredoxin
MDPVIAAGSPAPLFYLPDLNEKTHSLKEMLGRIIVLTFWSAECTWCERVDRELLSHLEAWNEQVSVWWVDSNANENRQLIKRVAAERNLPIVLIDRRQKVADLYGAQTTPHCFVIDRQGVLAYQGAWDDVTFRQRVPTQVYVPQVIQALLQNRAPSLTHTPPYGCTLVRSFETDS